MRKKTLILIATAIIITVLIILSLLLRSSVRTFKHGDAPPLPTFTSYEPLQYDSNDYSIKFEVPNDTEVNVSSDQGEQMKFSIYLVNSRLSFRGYLQLWKVKDLKSFLSDSKSLSTFDFRTYKIRNVQQGKYHGIINEWTIEFGQKLTSGKEYWLKIDNTEEVVRISFITDTADFPDNLQDVIQHILNSIEIKPLCTSYVIGGVGGMTTLIQPTSTLSCEK